MVSLVLVVSLLLLAGCGEGEWGANPPETPSMQGKPVTTMGTIAEIKPGTPGQTGRFQGKTVAEEDYCIEKQFAEATQGMSQQDAADYETGVISEAMARGLDPRTVLAERGFGC
jgi:hypothetical protein